MTQELLGITGLPAGSSRAAPRPRGRVGRLQRVALLALVAATTGGCASQPLGNLCRVEPAPPPDDRGDPYLHGQPVPESRSGWAPGRAGYFSPEHWACTRSDGAVRGLYALGGRYPCLAAIGDVRNSPEPEAPVDACPPWVPPISVAVYDEAATRARRDAGEERACCYRFRYPVVE